MTILGCLQCGSGCGVCSFVSSIIFLPSIAFVSTVDHYLHLTQRRDGVIVLCYHTLFLPQATLSPSCVVRSIDAHIQRSFPKAKKVAAPDLTTFRHLVEV